MNEQDRIDAERWRKFKRASVAYVKNGQMRFCFGSAYTEPLRETFGAGQHDQIIDAIVEKS